MNCISVLGYEHDFYPQLEACQRHTCFSVPQEGIQIIYNYGRVGCSELIGDRLYLDCIDVHENMSIKAHLSFKYYLDMGYTKLYFTNLSSYIRLDKINYIFNSLPDNNCYSGLIGHAFNSDFASGAGFFVSRDVLKLLYDNYDTFKPEYYEVAYAKFLLDRGLKIIPQPRFDVVGVDMPINYEDIENHYHFRCKQENRVDDIIVMYRIHAILNHYN